MNFQQKVTSGVRIVRVQSTDLTHIEAPEMKTHMLELMMGAEKKILINLHDVQNMDSTGLGAFLFGVRQAERYDKDLRFCEVHKKVKFLIHVAHLEDVIDIYDSEKDALEEFEE